MRMGADGHYEIEQILDRIYDKNKKTYQYKVKWLNYPAFEASFVDEQDSFREHMIVGRVSLLKLSLRAICAASPAIDVRLRMESSDGPFFSESE